MEELKSLLNSIEDTYEDFVSGILHYAGKSSERTGAVLSFLKNHPEATSSDVVKFVSDRPDFYEDAACRDPEKGSLAAFV